jgi:hypothetical protein
MGSQVITFMELVIAFDMLPWQLLANQSLSQQLKSILWLDFCFEAKT